MDNPTSPELPDGAAPETGAPGPSLPVPAAEEPDGTGVAVAGGDEAAELPVHAAPGDVTLGGSLSAAWSMFTSSWLVWVVVTAVYLLVSAALSVAHALVSPPDADGVPQMGPAAWAVLVVYVAVTAVATLALYRGGFEQVDGRTLQFSDFAKLSRWPALLGALVASAMLYALALLPSVFFALAAIALGLSPETTLVVAAVIAVVAHILVNPVATFAVMSVFDGAPARACVSVAWSAARPFYGRLTFILFAISLIGSAGVLLAGAGLLLTLPLSVLATVFMWRETTSRRRPVTA